MVYNIFPDSFADGKGQISKAGKAESYNGFPSVTNYGGTINGIRENLDYIKNLPMPSYVKERAEADFTERITDLIRTEKETGCDFLDIKKELYRKHHSYYAIYKDNYLDNLTYNISVNFSGQK